MYDLGFINQNEYSLVILKLINKKKIDRNFQLTPPFLNEAGLLSHDFEKDLLTKKVTVRKMPYLPPTSNSFASDSYDHQLKKFTKDVSNHTLTRFGNYLVKTKNKLCCISKSMGIHFPHHIRIKLTRLKFFFFAS